MSTSNDSSTSRLATQSADQKMIDGINKYLTQLPSLTVGSQTLTPAELVTTFQGRLTTSQAVQTAHGAWTAAVKADRDKRALTAPVVTAFKRLVEGMYSQSPDTLAVFGLHPVKVVAKTAATKAAAVVKTVATRAARHTMGSEQKKAVKGNVTGVVITPVTAPAPTVTTPGSPTAPATSGGGQAAAPTTAGSTPSGTAPAPTTVHSTQ